ncbi:unnamed protein product [Didymodactylos carnosus]|nr:unnamed protein product [Didymodactylos carnosus]CAF4519727.1 unnamed protein product [Didymodactylos carnosus]
MMNLSYSYKKEDYLSAIDNMRCIMSLNEKMNSTDAVELVSNNNFLGKLYFKNEQLDLALDYCTNALNTSFEAEVEDVELGRILNNLAQIWLKKGDYNQAWSYCSKSMEISVKGSATSKAVIGDNYEIIGDIYRYYGEKQLSYCCYSKSLKQLETVVLQCSNDIKPLQHKISNVHHSNSLIL